MLPFLYLFFYSILIILTGIIIYSLPIFSNISVILFAWLWFNIFIAIYEFYIVYHKRRFASVSCPNDFWNTPVYDDFWFRAWLEYTCNSDVRYLNPRDTVFYIEGLNAILVVCMWMALLFGFYPLVIYLLILQIANCIIYFITLYQSKKIKNISMKMVIYLAISSLWIFVPFYIVSFI